MDEQHPRAHPWWPPQRGVVAADALPCILLGDIVVWAGADIDEAHLRRVIPSGAIGMIPSNTKVFLASYPIDVRKGPDSLLSLVRDAGGNPIGIFLEDPAHDLCLGRVNLTQGSGCGRRWRRAVGRNGSRGRDGLLPCP
jgi:hypothetical protein